MPGSDCYDISVHFSFLFIVEPALLAQSVDLAAPTFLFDQGYIASGIRALGQSIFSNPSWLSGGGTLQLRQIICPFHLCPNPDIQLRIISVVIILLRH